jgi:hypothetical protein
MINNDNKNDKQIEVADKEKILEMRDKLDYLSASNKDAIKIIKDNYYSKISSVRDEIYKLECKQGVLKRECEEKVEKQNNLFKREREFYEQEVRKTARLLYLLILQDNNLLKLTIRDQMDRISPRELLESSCLNKYRQEVKLILPRIYLNDYVELTPAVVTMSSDRCNRVKNLELNVYIKGFIKTPQVLYSKYTYKDNIKSGAGYLSLQDYRKIWVYIPVTTLQTVNEAEGKLKMIQNRVKEFCTDIDNFLNSYIPLMENSRLEDYVQLLENKNIYYELERIGLDYRIQQELRAKYNLRKEIEE